MTELEKACEKRLTMLKLHTNKGFSMNTRRTITDLIVSYGKGRDEEKEALAERILPLIEESKTEEELRQKLETIRV